MNQTNSNLHVYTVTEITTYIKGLLETDNRLQDVLVKGEISNYRIPGKHLYFSLKDGETILPCIMFEDKLQNLKFDLQNGLEVVVLGSMGVYSPQGRYQLYAEELFPMGKGLLYLALEKLKTELMQKGYFDPMHKLPLPPLPQRIGMATSLQGAAIKDILKVLDARFPNLDIIIAPCRVQGEEAPAEIAEAIKNLNEYAKIDVIIVARGGGSMEDLFAFNNKIVADAIYNSRIPVITAIGHEIDQTIADFVADKSAPTPSVAAQLVVPIKDELLWQFAEKRKKIKNLITNKKMHLEAEIVKFKKLLKAKHPKMYVLELKQRLDGHYRRIRDHLRVHIQIKTNILLKLSQGFTQTSPERKLNLYEEKLLGAKRKLIQADIVDRERKYSRCRHLKSKLENLSPYSVLKRGYSICLKLPELKVITNHSHVKEGDKLKLKLYKGSLRSQVYKIEEQ